MKGVDDGAYHAVRTGLVLDMTRVDDGLQSTGLDLDIDVGAHGGGVAVEVDGSLGRAVDMQTTGLEVAYVVVALDGLRKELHEHLRTTDALEWLDDDDVEQSVLHRCLWGDIGVVAVLGGVGTGYEEGLIVQFLAGIVLDGQRVVVWLIAHAFLQHHLCTRVENVMLSVRDGMMICSVL